jgi:signal transduction histidine kinase
MQQANGPLPSLLTLLIDNCPTWLNDISSYLSSANYHSNTVHNADDAWVMLQNQRPDAVLAADSPEIQEFFQAVRESFPPEDQPLLVLIADYYPPNDVYQKTADIIASPEPIYLLEHQLRNFLYLRAQNVKLSLHNQQLVHELDLEKQTATGIEILKNAIVRNVAHELRTPLLQVKSAVALMAEDAGDISTLIDLAQRATTRLEVEVQNITLLNELINESLNKQDFEAVVLKETVDSALRNLRRIWAQKENVDRVKVFLPKNPPLVLGDKHRLAIALQLLIDNALKFSKESKKPVEVIFRHAKKTVHIAVHDYGIGIPQDKIDKIFDPFYQVDNSSTKAYGGMGIGLPIVRFILARHGAAIVVETKVGTGSTFSFSLPAANLNQTKNLR